MAGLSKQKTSSLVAGAKSPGHWSTAHGHSVAGVGASEIGKAGAAYKEMAQV